MRDGAVTRLSVGFEPRTWEETKHDDGSITIRHTAVHLREVSMVPTPPTTTPPSPNTAPPRPDRNPPWTPSPATTSPPRRAARRPRPRSQAHRHHPDHPAGSQWRSMGELLKAIAAGDQDAADFHRAYTGATTGDTVMKDTFVGSFIKLIQDRRRIANLFSSAPLPDAGLSLDYVKVKSDTTQVTEQAAEGDDLPSGKVELDSASAPVKTYGGWTQLTLQLIERATVPVLDTTLTALGLKYGRITDTVVANQFKALETANAASAITLAASADADDWLDAIVDVALAFEDADLAMSGLICTPARFKQLLKLKDGDNRLMRVWGTGVNQIGELDLSAISGDLAGVKVTPRRRSPTAASTTRRPSSSANRPAPRPAPGHQHRQPLQELLRLRLRQRPDPVPQRRHPDQERLT
ncbi:phage major capsid protein [Tessaracoccus sp. HDW20]|nr:phage major capsid protein [Tessaracoccus coleopterorum]